MTNSMKTLRFVCCGVLPVRKLRRFCPIKLCQVYVRFYKAMVFVSLGPLNILCSEAVYHALLMQNIDCSLSWIFRKWTETP